MGKLDGRVAIITGATRGLGRALASALDREGAELVLAARGAAGLEDAARAFPRALTVVADMREPRDLERLVSMAMDTFGRIDILVNNASELGPTPLAGLTDTEAATLEDVLKVNLVAPFILTRAVLGGMRMRRSGVVVNVTSDAAVNGYPGWGAYSASKSGLEGLTRVWAAELEGTGVRIHAVDPGDMDTDMHRAADPDADPADLLRPELSAQRLLALIVDDGARLGRPRMEAVELATDDSDA